MKKKPRVLITHYLFFWNIPITIPLFLHEKALETVWEKRRQSIDTHTHTHTKVFKIHKLKNKNFELSPWKTNYSSSCCWRRRRLDPNITSEWEEGKRKKKQRSGVRRCEHKQFIFPSGVVSTEAQTHNSISFSSQPNSSCCVVWSSKQSFIQFSSNNANSHKRGTFSECVNVNGLHFYRIHNLIPQHVKLHSLPKDPRDSFQNCPTQHTWQNDLYAFPRRMRTINAKLGSYVCSPAFFHFQTLRGMCSFHCALKL